MDSGDKLGAFAVGCLATVLLTLIITVTIVNETSVLADVTRNDSDNAAIVKMVEHGADPIAARCAMRSVGPDCTILAVRKN